MLKENKKIDEYSLLWNNINHINISTSKSNNEFYQQYMLKYKQDKFIFKLNRFYGLNIPALILGPIFYMYSGLYLGLFLTLLLTMTVTQILFNIYPNIFHYFPMFMVGNIIGALLANYFILLKSVSNFHLSLKYTQDKSKLIEYTETLNLKYKWINFLIFIPYSIFLFYLLMYIYNPSYLLNPIESFHLINKELISFSSVTQ